MVRIPAARRETRPWRQQSRGGTREDRMLREIMVTIPVPLASVELSIGGEIAELVDSATQSVAALDATHGPALAGLSGLLLRTESVASSKIEHIDASVDDYARAMHGSKANSSATSMVAASRAMDSLMSSATTDRRVSREALLRAHAILMAHESGEHEHAGRIRRMQNWVGGSDYSPRGALLVPPPPEMLDELLADLERFVDRTDLPSIVQATFAHAQFETLHPFTDGNGRIGRAMVNAILRARGTTSSVVVPIASALVARRDAYFSALDSFRDGDADPLIRSFAKATAIAARESRMSASRIVELPDSWRKQLGRTRGGSAPVRLLEHLLTHPVVSAADVETAMSVAPGVAYAAIHRLEDEGIVRCLTSRKRDQVWGAVALLDELADLDVRIRTTMTADAS